MLGGNVTALTLTQNAATVDCEVKPKIYDLWTEQNWIFLSLIVIEFSHHFPLQLRNPYSFGLKPFEINKKVVMVENWTRGSSVRGDYKRYVSKFSKSILKGCKGAHSKWKNVFCEKSIDSTHFLHFWLSVTEAFHLVSAGSETLRWWEITNFWRRYKTNTSMPWDSFSVNKLILNQNI